MGISVYKQLDTPQQKDPICLGKHEVEGNFVK